jgi:ABC-type bacteriocin/lantibiotic exporter with double-glycine peptidase domain
MIRQLYIFLKNGLGKKEKYFLFYGILCVTFFVLYNTSLPYFLKVWIDESLKNKDLYFVGQFGAFLFAATIVAVLIDWLGAYFLIKVRENSRSQIRLKLISQLQKIPISEVEKKESGYFTGTLLSDVDCATGMIVSVVYMVVPAVISLPVSVYWSFKLSNYFAIIGMTGFVLICVNIYLFSPAIRRSSETRQDLYSKASGIIQESIFANFFIRVSQIEEQIITRNSFVLNLLREASIKKHVIDYSAGTIERFITQILQVAAVFVCILAIIKYKADLTAAAIMTGIFYLIKIWSPINLFSSLNAELQTSLASSKRIFDIIESKVEQETGTVDLGGKIKEITCNNISINIDTKKLITNLNLQIKQRTKLGIKGKSGCGKTTLLKTLLGFHTNWIGSIQFNEINIRDIVRATMLKRIGYMPQDIFIFRENLFFNIALSYSYNSKRMTETLYKLHLNQLLSQTNKEVLTPANISGGEKKRIGLARLYYADKEIIMLDEPFSGIDDPTREKIYNEIFLAFKNKTIIIVSHDDRDLRECDSIIDLTEQP